MTDPRELPHLVLLLDDPSPVVEEGVRRALDGYGDTLPGLLRELEPPLTGAQRDRISYLLQPQSGSWLRAQWPGWRGITDDDERLERAATLISDYLGHRLHPRPLAAALDELAADFESRSPELTPRGLARFLFEETGYHGDEADYNRPELSDLATVIQSGRGIPLSLALLYRLVGVRVGLRIESCNFPSHFLARVRDGERTRWVDCFHGGRFLAEEDLLPGDQTSRRVIRSVLHAHVPPEAIVIRMLNNLARAFEATGNGEARKLMVELLATTMREEPPPAVPAVEPALRVGQLVRHCKYGYRGVVVAIDPRCRADDSWYWRNATQPERNQPWYSVLVDAGDHVTYAAEANLEPDLDPAPVAHPLLDQFFEGFQDGQYLRNRRPWPGW